MELWGRSPSARRDLGYIPLAVPLALEAARTGGTAGAILNGANEAAVARFLEGKIGFLDIAEQVARAMDQVPVVQRPTLEDILEADRAARAV